MKCYRNQFRWMAALAVLFVASGCGNDGPRLAKVEGVVTLDGTPLPEAVVFFSHDGGGRISQAETDPNGHFQLIFNSHESGAIVGPNTVRISTFVDANYNDAGQLIPGTGKKERVPKKYNKETELKVEVKPGSNEFKFDLTT